MNPRKTVSVELRTCATQRFSPPPLLMSLYRKAELKVFVTPPPHPPPSRGERQPAADQRTILEDGAAICLRGAQLQFKAARLVITAGARPAHDGRGIKREKKEEKKRLTTCHQMSVTPSQSSPDH